MIICALFLFHLPKSCYQKNFNLTAKLNQLLLTKQSLSDISEYLNLEVIRNHKQQKSTKKWILAVNLDNKVYATTFLINFLKMMDPKESKLLIEGNNINYSMIDYFNAFDYAKVDDLKREYFIEQEIRILFNQRDKWDKELVLKLLLNLNEKYDINVIDYGKFELNDNIFIQLLEYVEELMIFNSDSLLFKTSQDYQQKLKYLESLVISKRIINQDQIRQDSLNKLYHLGLQDKIKKIIPNYFKNDIDETHPTWALIKEIIKNLQKKKEL